jgi:aminoglycoside 3-N-acetyltransferase
MSRINTLGSLVTDLSALGLRRQETVMVHSSLGAVGYTVGGPVVVVRALLQLLTPHGTLVMAAESPSISDPAHWNDSRIKPEWHDVIREHLPVFDPGTTPTTMGAIPEAFRTYPGTRRSDHPLLGVGFGRCTSLHYAESLVPRRRTTLSRFPLVQDGRRVWVEKPDMAAVGRARGPDA